MTLRQSALTVGRYQYRVLAVYLLVVFGPSNIINTGILVMAPNVGHWCLDNSQAFSNLSESHREQIKGVCERPALENISEEVSSNMTKCKIFSYDHSQFDYTITERFDLVCDRKWIVSMTSTVYIVGMLVGAATSGMLADKFGRIPVLYVLLVIGCAGNVLSVFCPDLTVYLLVRCVLGMTDIAVFTTGLVHAVELVRKDQRVIVKVAENFATDLADLFLGVVSFGIRDYRYIHALVAIIYFICAVLYFFLVCESPRWLASQNRTEQAKKVVESIAKYNGQSVHKLAHLKQFVVITKSTNVRDLFRTPVIRKHSLTLFLIWPCMMLVRYALLYNLGNFSSDVRISIIIVACLEIPTSVMSFIVVSKFGRQITVFALLFIAGICCLSMTPFVSDVGSPVLLTLAITGRVVTGNISFVVYLYTQELYPTVVRNTGLGACSTVARVAAMLAPQINLLNDFWPPLMVVILGVVSILGSLLVPLLPDTTGKELHQSIEVGESANKHKYRFQCPERTVRPRQRVEEGEDCL